MRKTRQLTRQLESVQTLQLKSKDGVYRSINETHF